MTIQSHAHPNKPLSRQLTAGIFGFVNELRRVWVGRMLSANPRRLSACIAQAGN
jgi:hypothetical protein